MILRASLLPSFVPGVVPLREGGVRLRLGVEARVARDAVLFVNFLRELAQAHVLRDSAALNCRPRTREPLVVGSTHGNGLGGGDLGLRRRGAQML